MKFDSEGLWRHAENVAYKINEAFLNMKSMNECKTNMESFMKCVENINGDCSKGDFECACSFFIQYIPGSSASLKDAVKYSMSIPLKGEDEDGDMTFSYFMTLCSFHLAAYKAEWKRNKKKSDICTR